MHNGDVLLDDGTWIALAQCGMPRPIATFTSYVEAMRAAWRVNRYQHTRHPADPAARRTIAMPVWIDY